MTKIFLRHPPDENSEFMSDTLRKMSKAQRDFYWDHRDHMHVDIEFKDGGVRIHCRTCKVVCQ